MIEQYLINSFTNCVFAYDGIDTKSYKIIAIETTFDTFAACRLFLTLHGNHSQTAVYFVHLTR